MKVYLPYSGPKNKFLVKKIELKKKKKKIEFNPYARGNFFKLKGDNKGERVVRWTKPGTVPNKIQRRLFFNGSDVLKPC